MARSQSIPDTGDAGASLPQAEEMTFAEYLERDLRLAARPEMQGAFLGLCRRLGVYKATKERFAQILKQMED